MKPEGYTWVGQRFYTINLQKDSEVHLTAAITKPGMYNLASVGLSVMLSSQRIVIPRPAASLVTVMDATEGFV